MRRLVVILALLFGVAPAQAEWHLESYLGGAHTHRPFLVLDQPATATNLRFEHVSFTGQSFGTPLYYGVRSGYFLGSHLGFDAEFIHLKVFSRVAETIPVQGILKGRPVAGLVPLNSVVGCPTSAQMRPLSEVG
jgi:hypothetical protein